MQSEGQSHHPPVPPPQARCKGGRGRGVESAVGHARWGERGARQGEGGLQQGEGGVSVLPLAWYLGLARDVYVYTVSDRIFSDLPAKIFSVYTLRNGSGYH